MSRLGRRLALGLGTLAMFGILLVVVQGFDAEPEVALWLGFVLGSTFGFALWAWTES